MSLAAVLGVSVSVAQYLPRLLSGGGRIPSLTTEAVAPSMGSDRRVAAENAGLEAVLRWLVYLAVLVVPALVHRNHRAQSDEGT